MEGIQKDIDTIHKYMLDLQLATGIETTVVVKTTKEEDEYFFTILINVNGEFEPAAEDLDFDSVICYLSGVMIGHDMAMGGLFKKTFLN